MKNRIVGAVVFVSCVALVLVACAPVDTTTVDNVDTSSAGVTLDNSENTPRDYEYVPDGGEIIEANRLEHYYKYLGEVGEFTARLANGRVVQCITWEEGGDGAGVACDWDSDGAPGSDSVTGGNAVTETVTVTDTP